MQLIYTCVSLAIFQFISIVLLKGALTITKLMHSKINSCTVYVDIYKVRSYTCQKWGNSNSNR